MLSPSVWTQRQHNQRLQLWKNLSNLEMELPKPQPRKERSYSIFRIFHVPQLPGSLASNDTPEERR